MPKLTEAQKAQNKARQKERQTAYTARYQEYHTAKEAAMAQFDVAHADLRLAAESANAACDEALADCDREERAIRTQIAELEAKLKSLRGTHHLEEKAAHRRQATSAYYAARRQAEADIEAAYPDMAGTYGAAEWEGKLNKLGLAITLKGPIAKKA